jgi:hypothetical protein
MPLTIARTLIGIAGLLGILLACRLWLNPVDAAASLGLVVQNTLGVATIRADVAGFFMVTGGFLMAAALKSDARLLLPPTLLVAAALGGRIITFAFTEAAIETLPPMVIEVVLLVLFDYGRRVFRA